MPTWAAELDLSPHPEGGWFRETWRSELILPKSALPEHYSGPRNAGTAILFLLLPDEESAWHMVASAELWMHHRGSPLELQFGSEKATASRHLLGSDVVNEQSPSLVVPPGHWQRARPRGSEATLVTCVVVPGFDFADFTMTP